MEYNILNIDDFSFREEQKSAIRIANQYIEDFFNQKANNKSCLICMPTGSGKTGVFAYLSRGFINPKQPGVLVLSPRIKITQQIYRETFSSFFQKLTESIEISKLPKKGKLVEIHPSQISFNFSEDVYFMTFQMLISIGNSKSSENKIFQKLVDNIGLIIIDEGHYEPAHKWASCIRKFKLSSKIIFTATPYRNDFREFDVSKNHIYFCSYKKALSQKYVRKVELLNSPNTLDENDFTAFFLNEFMKLREEGKIKTTSKAILRCDNHLSIKKIASILAKRKINFLGIHEQFKYEKDPLLISAVPEEIEKNAAIVWIHQYKLMEGVDAPSFQFIGCFNSHQNTRQIIQEIGRGLRRTESINEDEILYYLDNENGKSFHRWERYIKLDTYIDQNHSKLVLNIKETQEKILELYPEFIYIFNEIRERAKFEEIDPEKDILLPLKCNVYLCDDIDLTYIFSLIESHLSNIDRITYKFNSKDICQICILHSGINQNKYLKHHLLPENNAEIIFIYLIAPYLFVFDNTKIIRTILISNVLATPLNEEQLKKTISSSKKSKIRQVALQNLSQNLVSIQKKELHALNLLDVTTSLDDFSHSCTKILGYTFDNNIFKNQLEFLKRYIGFKNATVIQDSSCRYTLNEYRKWVGFLKEVISSSRKKSSYFERYATATTTRKKLKPSSILLFVNEFLEEFDYINQFDTEPDDYFCCPIEEDKFSIRLYKKNYTFTISYTKSQKFNLSCDEFDLDFPPKDNLSYHTASSFFNLNQSFSIIYTDMKYVYLYGNIYEPEIKLGIKYDENQFDILSLLHSLNILNAEHVNSEKGTIETEINGVKTWADGSIFRLISDLKIDESISTNDINYFICDDLGTEIADFVLCTNKKVIFLHAKYGKGSEISASKLHEVCSQAIKNISYLSPFNQIKPKNLNRWGKEWRLKEQSIPRILKKLNGVEDTNTLWTNIQKSIAEPTIDKEVWLVLGGLLSKQKLSENLKTVSTYRAEALQICLQLLNCAKTVNSFGAKLKVFCSE
ncbi:DEAD/DEAH box helicase family protein [Legionella pneumophila serogroup 1]